MVNKFTNINKTTNNHLSLHNKKDYIIGRLQSNACLRQAQKCGGAKQFKIGSPKAIQI